MNDGPDHPGTANARRFSSPTSPAESERELFETLIERGPVRIERIISTGQHSPPGFWYDQDWDEWVTILSGSAEIAVLNNNGQQEPHALGTGDSLFLPAHVKHRVERTDAAQPTVWLAVHIRCELSLPGKAHTGDQQR